MELKDSGSRREFASGAVRDIDTNKGRCDLLPLGVVAELLDDKVFSYIDTYIHTGDRMLVVAALKEFATARYGDLKTAVLEVSKHYSDGCKKYGERNWEKGINLHCYVDSGVRHYLKYLRGDTDEPHDRAFVWNMLGALWTHEQYPDLCDLPFCKEVHHD